MLINVGGRPPKWCALPVGGGAWPAAREISDPIRPRAMFSSHLVLWARSRLASVSTRPFVRPWLAHGAAVQLPVAHSSALAGSSTHGAAVSTLPVLDTAARMLMPALTAAVTLLPRATTDLIPSILLVGKRRTSGKSKRHPKRANHGARPCNHVGRRQRAAAMGSVKYQPKR